MAGEQTSRIDNTKALAEHLGLSRWTVSRVLNGHPGVRAETRARVEAAMEELGFAPNPMARGLRGRKTRLIGICLHELDNPVLSGKAMALQKFLRSRGYHALLELTGSERTLEPIVLQTFLGLKVDGIILVASRLRPQDSVLRQIVSAGVPIVALDPMQTLPIPTVRLDRATALQRLAEAFLTKGHRRLTLAGISPRLEYGTDRVSGVEAALRAAGLDPKADLQVYEKAPGLADSVRAGFELAERMLAAGEVPQAIIAANDRIAMGIVQRFRAAGWVAPKSYSIAGFDNLEMGLCCSPALTTVDQQVDALIESTVELLLKIVEQDEPIEESGEVVRIEPLVVRRESIGPPAGREVR